MPCWQKPRGAASPMPTSFRPAISWPIAAMRRAVVARIRERGIAFVQGNCEEQLAAGAEDCGCGFAPGSSCDRLSAAWFTHAMGQLNAADRAFLGTAPAVLRIDMNGVRLAFIHGAAASINRFVFGSRTVARQSQ